MKLIVCDKCSQVIPLEVKKERSCKCGAISGKYRDDGLSGIIHLKKIHGVRILAIDTNLIRGFTTRSVDYVFEWENSGLEVWFRGKLLNETPPQYGLKNAHIFLNDSIHCLLKSKMKGKKNILKNMKDAARRMKRALS